MSDKTIFNIPDKDFTEFFEDSSELESPLVRMRRVHPDLAKTKDGKGLIIHGKSLDKHISLRGEGLGPLEYLNLAESTFEKITFEGNFPNLKHIDLSKCKLSAIDFSNAQMPKLQQLYLRNNALEAIKLTASLPQLELLDLGENPFLQEIILATDLPALKYLYLYKKKEGKDDKKKNQPIQGFAFRSMPNLKVLDIENGGLTELPSNFLTLKKLETLYLSGNRPKGIPDDVIGQGERHNSVREVLLYLSSDATKPLRQSKLFFIGNGEVGKTSLVRKLLDRKADLVDKPDRTNTIDVVPFPVKDLKPKETGLDEVIDYHFEIWDFGGQENYREIQQLFCSPKSLYVFVTSYDDERKEDYVGYEYWLSMVKAYGRDDEKEKDSPVIGVINKIDEKPKSLNEKEIEDQFPNVSRFHKVSAATLDGFEDFAKHIRQSIKGIADNVFTDEYAQAWIGIKEKLEQHNKPYISVQEYLDDFCKDVFERDEDALTWLRILDRIGTVIYFGQHEKLKDWIILKPEWLKVALTEVITYAFGHYGVVQASDLPGIWADYKNDEPKKFIELLLNYKLAFPKKNDYGAPIYVIPSALSVKEPSLPSQVEGTPTYRLKFKFSPFVPAGTVSKLTVGLFGITFNRLYWRKNVILHDNYQSFARVTEDWENSAVDVSFYGENPNRLFQLVYNELKQNTEDLKQLRQIKNLDFSVLVDDEGDWLAQKTVQRFNLEKFKFLWTDDLAEKGALSHLANRIHVQGNKNIIIQDNSGNIHIQQGNENASDDKDDKPWWTLPTELGILFLGANPPNTDFLDVEKEQFRISQVLGVHLKMKKELSTNLDDIHQLVFQHKPHIIHFSGHGVDHEEARQVIWEALGLPAEKPQSGLILHDKSKRGSEIWPGDEVAKVFRNKKKLDVAPLHLMILNNCFSEGLAKAISEAGIYVVGTTKAIKDNLAIGFAEGFYRALSTQKIMDQNELVHVLSSALSELNEDEWESFALYFNGKSIKI